MFSKTSGAWGRTNDLKSLPRVMYDWDMLGLYMMPISLEVLWRGLFQTDQRTCVTHLLRVSEAVHYSSSISFVRNEWNTLQHYGPELGVRLPCPAGCFEMISQFMIWPFNKGLWLLQPKTVCRRSGAITPVSVLLSGSPGQCRDKKGEQCTEMGRGEGVGGGGETGGWRTWQQIHFD